MSLTILRGSPTYKRRLSIDAEVGQFIGVAAVAEARFSPRKAASPLQIPRQLAKAPPILGPVAA